MKTSAVNGQAAEIFAKLADKAWQQLGSRPLAALSLNEIAQLEDVDPALAAAVAGDPQQLVLGKMLMLNEQAILESFSDIKDAGDISIREKILETLMHRFEIYAPYREQVNSLNQAACMRPDFAIGLGLALHAFTRRALAMSGDSCVSWRGLMRIKGVVAVVIVVSRVWMSDDSPDLAPTMKELDRRLQQAEEWAISLRLFQQPKQSKPDAANFDYRADND